MTSNSPEETIINNVFGTVTNKRVTYLAKKGWFGGGSREDVPINKVVSVRYGTDRKVFWGLFLIVLGLLLLVYVVGLLPIVVGILFIWGSPTVNVITAGGTQTPVVGLPWQKKQADDFASAVRSQIFSE